MQYVTGMPHSIAKHDFASTADFRVNLKPKP